MFVRGVAQLTEKSPESAEKTNADSATARNLDSRYTPCDEL